MSADLFMLCLFALFLCIHCGYILYKPHLFLSETKKYILFALCSLIILLFFFSIFFPMTYGLAIILYGITIEYRCYLNEDNYPDNVISRDRSEAVVFVFIGFFYILILYH